MKPTELRIGNIVKFEENIYTVGAINTNSVSIKNEDNQSYIRLEELKGSDIIEETLFDLGFSKRYDVYNLHIGEINIEVSKSGMGNFWWVSLNDSSDLKVKYIHQIQNIISALTEDI